MLTLSSERSWIPLKVPVYHKAPLRADFQNCFDDKGLPRSTDFWVNTSILLTSVSCHPIRSPWLSLTTLFSVNTDCLGLGWEEDVHPVSRLVGKLRATNKPTVVRVRSQVTIFKLSSMVWWSHSGEKALINSTQLQILIADYRGQLAEWLMNINQAILTDL